MSDETRNSVMQSRHGMNYKGRIRTTLRQASKGDMPAASPDAPPAELTRAQIAHLAGTEDMDRALDGMNAMVDAMTDAPRDSAVEEEREAHAALVASVNAKRDKFETRRIVDEPGCIRRDTPPNSQVAAVGCMVCIWTLIVAVVSVVAIALLTKG